MKCPACPETLLVMSERQGVEIDYCPQCRGVWLDRGELDKLLERAAQSPPPAYGGEQRRESHPQKSYDKHEHHQSAYSHRRKHSSWLSEIFD